MSQAIHPTELLCNRDLDSTQLRSAIFHGSLLLRTNLASTQRIAEAAIELLQDVFQTDDIRNAYKHLPRESFAKLAAKAKTTFTNDLSSKQLLRAFAVDCGLRPAEFYFDVPRLRIVPNYDYLHAGVSYAYAAHRDPWYGGPQYQINHWMPVVSILPEQTMAIYPGYFAVPVPNTSEQFDLEHWVKNERARAVENIQVEGRMHPLPMAAIDTSSEIRIAGGPGDIMIFSGHHLHATIPNRTDETRFSVDFRFFHVDDIRSGGFGDLAAPANIDSRARSHDFGLRSLFSLDTFESFDELEALA